MLIRCFQSPLNLPVLQVRNNDFCQAVVSVKISNFLICFCRFDLFSPILDKDRFIVLSH